MRLTLAAAIALAVPVSVLPQDRTTRQADVAGLRDAPAGALVIGVHAPVRVLASTLSAFEDLLPAESRARLLADLDEARDAIGLDLREERQWRERGFDPLGDWSLALSVPGGFLGLPQECVIALPVSDPGVLEAFVVERLKEEDPDLALRRHVSPSFVSAEGLAWAFFGQRGLVYGRSGVEPARLDELMARCIARQGGEGTIGSTRIYRTVRDRLETPASLGLYFSPRNWEASKERPDEDDESGEEPARAPDDARAGDGRPSDLQELLLAVDDEGLVLAAEMAQPLLDELRAPAKAELSALVAALPKPDALLVSNLADPGRTLRRWSQARLAFGGTSGSFVPLDEDFPREGELAAAGLALWLPARASGEPIRGIAFLLATDEGRAEAVFTRLLERMRRSAAQVEGARIEPLDAAPGFSGFLRSDGAGEFVARSGRTVCFGDARDALRAVTAGGEPRPTGLAFDAAIEAIVDLAALAGRARNAPASATAFQGCLHLRLKAEGEHLVFTVRREGVAQHAPFFAEMVALLGFLRID
ncbi:MAG: hypothetical protein IT457_07105 [Planctomycetes bacterium]|nr:hypothetical protein [Planctomycetota bacterium]